MISPQTSTAPGACREPHLAHVDHMAGGRAAQFRVGHEGLRDADRKVAVAGRRSSQMRVWILAMAVTSAAP
jgi:hypothetical protein